MARAGWCGRGDGGLMMCDQCALEVSCPAERRGEYGRRCWVAFGLELESPDCLFYRERYWRGGEKWLRGNRVNKRGGRHGYGG